MRGLNAQTLLVPTTKDTVKNNMERLKKPLCDEGDEITTLMKGIEDAFNKLFNIMAEMQSKSDEKIFELFYGHEISSLRET